MEAIKSKIAKLLRMQQSPNANEAANAAEMVERLCKQYGISQSDVSSEYDPLLDEAERRDLLYMGKKINYGKAMLLSAVAEYFDGKAVITNPKGCVYQYGERQERVASVVASKGNFVQIELYFDYLLSTAERLADEAKRASYHKLPRSFKQDFIKGFAQAICLRLREMKKHQQRDLSAEGEAKNRHSIIRVNNVMALYRREFPNVGSGAKFRLGKDGAIAGREAAQNVGLNKQATGSQRLSLTAG